MYLISILGGGFLILIGKYFWNKNKTARINAEAILRRQKLTLVIKNHEMEKVLLDAKVKEFDDAYEDYHSNKPDDEPPPTG